MNGIAASSPNLGEQNLLTTYCLDNDIPFLPTSGLWSVPAWAKFLCQEEETVRDWVKVYEIPHRGTTRKMFVDAEHLREAIPVDFLFSEPEEPKNVTKKKSPRKR